MSDHLNFDAVADAYEAGRPPYPPRIWELLREAGLLRTGDRAWDLGAGTGLATRELVSAGMHVTAVEPGPVLAARLRERFPEAQVHTARAEDVPLEPASVDLALAATSVHWLDLNRLLPKLRTALTPDGAFAVVHNRYGDPEWRTPFRAEVARIAARQTRATPQRSTPSDAEGVTAAVLGTGLWDLDRAESVTWTVELDAAQVRDLFTSFSDWSAPDAAAVAAVAERLGPVTERYSTWLRVFRPA
ncbi:class I SAM-dependent methyltransferase [Microbacterium gorillae]|uniref:class I SAM-dependent methyltransferase n=1 Tax=Microbacterium gorillae TaxID=1231063 RepID=UPI000590230E|nr:class I SAM-dependent methyltransferase [Microbacterium gorillae]